MDKKLLPLRVLAVVSAWIAAGCVLHRYEYFASFADIDNVVGMMPFVMALTGAAGVSVLVLMRHTRQFAPFSAALAAAVVLCAVLFPAALRGNWWLNMRVYGGTDAEEGFDLTDFAPFTGSERLVRLDEPSTLTLYGDLPVLDGATALFPVYAAFAEAVFARDSFAADKVLSTNTINAYEALIAGERDIIFAAGASERQREAAREAGAELYFTPIGREAFVFVAGRENPLDDITFRQIRSIYTGKTAHWRTLGWPGGGRIIAFMRPEGSGSQTGLQKIMGGLPVKAPQPMPGAVLAGTNSLMNEVSLRRGGVQPAIGFSYRFFAAYMHANPDAKILSVEGIFPSAENIRNGSYPFAANFYAVTNGAPSGSAKKLIEWILSPQGQRIIEETGYVGVALR